MPGYSYADVHADMQYAPATTTPPIRVASVPSSHVYVRHLAPLAAPTSGPTVRRLPDPHPTEPGRVTESQWWPPRMLDHDWVRANAHSFDLFHIQFGFDALAPDELRRIVAELRSAGKPLVYTAHDLRNPHHLDRRDHDAQLQVLMGEADAVVTLTEGAAREIRARWGRDAVVIPHPHVVDFDTLERTRSRRTSKPTAPFRVGLHVKSLRANVNPIPVVRALVETLHEHPDWVVQVDGHPDVFDTNSARYDDELTGLLHDYSRRGLIDLRVHDYFSDAELWRYLASLDASVLPYRFGTHSGWLEACRDLGTDVIAPTCGYYSDQGPVRLYRNDEKGFDADSLISAVATSARSGAAERLSVDFRMSQRDRIAVRHQALYAELLA